MKKHAFRRVIGLCTMAALVLMAFAASAQAEVGAKWLIEKSNSVVVTAGPTLEPGIGVKEVENRTVTLLSKVLGQKFEILCTGMNFENAVLKAEGGSLGKIKFTGCVEIVNGTIQPACEPHTGTEKGVILTKLLKDLIVLHEGPEGYDRLEPEEGTTLVTVESGEECSVGPKIPIIGKIVFEDCKVEGRILKVDHLIEEFTPLTELWIISKTVEHLAHIDGSVILTLIGEHAGLKWAGDPA
jgi:hypothetical protein